MEKYSQKIIRIFTKLINFSTKIKNLIVLSNNFKYTGHDHEAFQTDELGRKIIEVYLGICIKV